MNEPVTRLGSLLLAWSREAIETILENGSSITHNPTDEEILVLLGTDKDLDEAITYLRYRLDDLIADEYTDTEED